MEGFISGALGPTGPTPLVPTGVKLYQGLHLRMTTGAAYLGPTGGCSTGAGFPLSAMATATGPAMFVPIDNAKALHVLVLSGSELRYLGS